MEQIFSWIKEKKVLCGFLLLTLLCGVFASLYVVEVTAEEAYICPKTDVSTETSTSSDEVVVDIKGAVVNPGIYRVQESAIVHDIIVLAGGLTEDADTSNLNLSKKVTDEMVITVYTHEEVEKLEKQDAIVEADKDSSKTDDKSETGLISLNTATLEELMSLPGIGESKGKSIIQYRENCGRFTKKEDLLNISGIGEKVYAELEAYITI